MGQSPTNRGRYRDKSVAWFWWVGVTTAIIASVFLGAWGKAVGATWLQTSLTIIPLLVMIAAGFLIIGLLNKNRNLKG